MSTNSRPNAGSNGGHTGALNSDERAILNGALDELERATTQEQSEELRAGSGRFVSNLDLLRKIWDIEVDFNREEGNPETELWHRHFQEVNQSWNLRYAPPQVTGPDDAEKHVQLLRDLDRLVEPPPMSLDYRPTSHRRFIGKFIVGFKRLFFHLLQPYLAGLLDLLRAERERALGFERLSSGLHRETIRTLLLKRQTNFNAEVVRLLNELTKYVLFTRQKRFNREAKNLLEALPGQMGEVYAALERRLNALEQRDENGGQSQGSAEEADRLRELIARLERTLSGLNSGAGVEPSGRSIHEALGQIRDSRYQEFEDLFRGSREEIMRRQRRYIGYFVGCQRVVDLGCGRGEFLELCSSSGVGALGVDMNSEMVRTCQEMGLEAIEADVLDWLNSQPDGSVDGLFSAQVIEHLEKDALFALLRLAYLKLKPGSYLILETLNTDNLIVNSRFYADITHVRPIPSSTLEFLAKGFGFRETFVLYSSPVPEDAKLGRVPIEASGGGEQRWALEIINANFERLNGALYSYQDYALVARRPQETAAAEVEEDRP